MPLTIYDNGDSLLRLLCETREKATIDDQLAKYGPLQVQIPLGRSLVDRVPYTANCELVPSHAYISERRRLSLTHRGAKPILLGDGTASSQARNTRSCRDPDLTVRVPIHRCFPRLRLRIGLRKRVAALSSSITVAWKRCGSDGRSHCGTDHPF